MRFTFELEPVQYQDDQWVIRDEGQAIIFLDDSEHGAASASAVTELLNKLADDRDHQRTCEHRWEAHFTLDDDWAQCKLCGAREEQSNVECEDV